jgi:hypothetical protein
MDLGRKRNWIDQAVIGGELTFDVTRRLGGIARVMSMGPFTGKRAVRTPREMAIFVEEHKESLLWIAAHMRPTMKGITKASVLAAVARAYYHEETDRLEQFLHILRKGVSLGPEDSAAILLRDRLMQNELGVSDIWLLTNRAIKAFCESEELRRLRPTKWVYPLPE